MGVVAFVSTGNKASTVGVGFLGADIANKATICYIPFAVARYVRLVDELDGVGSFHAVADSLGKAAEFVGS